MLEKAMAYSLHPFHACTRALWMGALSSHGGIAMVAKIMACPLHDPKHDAMLIA
jgi:hypothetical protein